MVRKSSRTRVASAKVRQTTGSDDEEDDDRDDQTKLTLFEEFAKMESEARQSTSAKRATRNRVKLTSLVKQENDSKKPVVKRPKRAKTKAAKKQTTTPTIAAKQRTVKNIVPMQTDEIVC
jgi:hypothetical protein